jgi:hypothetical protein
MLTVLPLPGSQLISRRRVGDAQGQGNQSLVIERACPTPGGSGRDLPRDAILHRCKPGEESASLAVAQRIITALRRILPASWLRAA